MRYRGVSAHHNVPQVTDWASAQRALREGNMRSKIADMREREDGAIAFRLYTTDVVAWFPDGSVEIDNYGTVTTSGFARHFTPHGFYLKYAVSRRAASSDDTTIHFPGRDAEGNDARLVCQGALVRFLPLGNDRWEADEDTCDTVELPVGVDRKAARVLSKEYNLAGFANWLAMAPMHLAAAGSPIEHQGFDFDICCAALLAGDWRKAAEHLPLVEETNAFGIADRMRPLPIATSGWDMHITMGSLEKFRQALYDDKGLLRMETRAVWTAKDWEQGVRYAKQIDRAVGDNWYRRRAGI